MLQTEMFPFRPLHHNILSAILGSIYIFTCFSALTDLFFYIFTADTRQNVNRKRTNPTVRNESPDTCSHKAFWEKTKQNSISSQIAMTLNITQNKASQCRMRESQILQSPIICSVYCQGVYPITNILLVQHMTVA